MFRYSTFSSAFHPSVSVISDIESAGFVDCSWINESVPRWVLFSSTDEQQEAIVACIWIEPEDLQLRTEGATHKYVAQHTQYDGLTILSTLSTDDLSEALKFASSVNNLRGQNSEST